MQSLQYLTLFTILIISQNIVDFVDIVGNVDIVGTIDIFYIVDIVDIVDYWSHLEQG